MSLRRVWRGYAAGEQPAAPEAKEPVKAAALARFFIQQRQRSLSGAQPRVPLEALLLQIESHVRLEQAAAESFLEPPTPALLHGRTISPLVN